MPSLLMLIAVGLPGAIVNVRDHGATGDGATDDSAAFAAALGAARPGQTVFVPPGRYRLAGSLTIPSGVTLEGTWTGLGRQPDNCLLAVGGRGTADGPGLIVMAANSAVRRLAIEYPEQASDGDEPVPYPYAVKAAPSCRIEQLFLYNPYLGINLDECHSNLVSGVWGEPLRVGIHSDHTYDISHIENVHFWPYYTIQKPGLRRWVQANGVAFEFGRSDWQSVVNTFCYGYHTGYRFFHTEAVPERGYPEGVTNGSLVGIGADCVVYGVDVEDAFGIGVSITNGMFAPFGGADTRAILLRETNTGNLTLTGCNVWAVPDAVAEVRAGSLTLHSCNIQEWALHRDRPCFIATGGRLKVSGCTFNRGGRLAELSGDETLASFIGNQAAGPISVVNGIGGRAVFGLNLPELTVVGG